MMLTKFLLITLLCVLPPAPVARKNLLKHVHKDIHNISDLIAGSGKNFCFLLICNINIGFLPPFHSGGKGILRYHSIQLRMGHLWWLHCNR